MISPKELVLHTFNSILDYSSYRRKNFLLVELREVKRVMALELECCVCVDGLGVMIEVKLPHW